MVKRLFGISAVLSMALVILTISVLRTAAVKYSFSTSPTTYPSNSAILGDSTAQIEVGYQLAYPGTVLPDHPLWIVKAVRDRIWYVLTTNPDKKAELNLLFADKRLGSAKILLERGKTELAVSTLTKAEKYLQKALVVANETGGQGKVNTEFLNRIARASLVHRLIIEEMMRTAPEDVKPILTETQKYSKEIYKSSSDRLKQLQINPPPSPFSDN